MSYLRINRKYPEVREEELNLLKINNIYGFSQTPSMDCLVKGSYNPNIGLSFINLHHFKDSEKRKIIDKPLYKEHHIFDVPLLGANSLFLDSFISKYSKRKHKGYYLTDNTFCDYKHLTIETIKIHKIKWKLSEDIAIEYLRNLFCLDKNPSFKDLVPLNYNGYTLDWPILYIKLIANES